MLRYLLLFALLLPGRLAAAQQPDPEMTPNRARQVKWQVPAHWLVTRQRTDSVDVLRYLDPADGTRLWVGQLRGRHAHTPPARALHLLLRLMGAAQSTEQRTTAQGLDFLESSGTCRVQGRALRYEARVTTYQGQVRVVYLYATPVFGAQVLLLHQVFDRFAPLRGN